jgi:hypothetical protein
MSMFDRENDYHVGYFNEHGRRAKETDEKLNAIMSECSVDRDEALRILVQHNAAETVGRRTLSIRL